MFYKIDTKGYTSRAGTLYPAGASEFTHVVLSGVRVSQSKLFYIVFCGSKSFWSYFSLTITLSVLRLTASCYAYLVSSKCSV